MTEAIILGGSRGIGKAIADSLKSIEIDVFAASKKDIDTSNLDSVKKFSEIHNQTDILVLNTGGPAPKLFSSITEEDWKLYHNQLFLGFCTILQKIKINDDGYIFLISSSVIKEPNAKLIISSALEESISKSIESISAKRLNKIALPSITGFDASAPKLPKPSIAEPLLITATKLPFVV